MRMRQGTTKYKTHTHTTPMTTMNAMRRSSTSTIAGRRNSSVLRGKKRQARTKSEMMKMKMKMMMMMCSPREQRPCVAVCAAAEGASFDAGGGLQGDGLESISSYGVVPFGKTSVRDPFRRLGVSRDATFEEIKEARNYLMQVRVMHVSRKQRRMLRRTLRGQRTTLCVHLIGSSSVRDITKRKCEEKSS